MLPLRQAFSVFQRPLLVPRASSSALTPHIVSAFHARPQIRNFVVSTHRLKDDAPPTHTHSEDGTAGSEASPTPQTHITLETPEPRLSLTFTCTVEGCQTRSTHQFTKRSYQKGIVLVTCPGCKNRCVYADSSNVLELISSTSGIS